MKKWILLLLLIASPAFAEFQPDAKGLLTVQSLQKKIIKAARWYAIDPYLLEGIVYAEAAKSNITKEHFERYCAEHGITARGFLFWKDFGFGPGQVHPSTAFRIESYCAAFEKRHRRSRKKIVHVLLRDQIALNYAACVVSFNANTYLSYGIDIWGKPPIEATAYILGEPDKHATEDIAAHRDPAPNDFGLLVERYLIWRNAQP